MNINADLTMRAIEQATPDTWRATPQPGVTRRPLFRIGDEIAQATSLVRYAPGSHFHPHEHTGGEEILVLEGTFSDEHGDYPAGTYFRNPPGTRHSPYTRMGCLLLVRLWQFEPADHQSVVQHVPEWPWTARGHDKQVWPVHHGPTESVRLEYWPAGRSMMQEVPDGGEWLVLRGGFAAGEIVLGELSWLRLPCGDTLHAVVGEEGAWVWAKTGHLRQLPPPPANRSQQG
jgi:hypothetical protein